MNQVRHWSSRSSDVTYPRSSQTLTTLDLWDNRIGDGGAQHLGEALRVNQVRHWSMKFLRLVTVSTIITDTHNTESFAQPYRRWRSAASRRGLAGESSETLTTWSFPYILSPRSSQTLTTLDLSDNRIGDGGAQYLGEALRVNQVRH